MDPIGFGYDVVAGGDDAVGGLQVSGGHGLDQLALHLDGGAADGFRHRLQAVGVSHPAVVFNLNRQLALLQTLVNLWAGTVYEHHAHAQAVQQHYILDQLGKAGRSHRFTGKGDHKGLAPVGIDVGNAVAKPVYILIYIGAGVLFRRV